MGFIAAISRIKMKMHTATIALKGIGQIHTLSTVELILSISAIGLSVAHKQRM